MPNPLTRSPLESGAIDGDSPVREREKVDTRYPEYCRSDYPVGRRGTITPNPKYTPSPIAN